LAAGGVLPLDIDNTLTVAKLSNTFEVGTDHIFRLSGEYREGTNNFALGAGSAVLSGGLPQPFALGGDDLRYEIMSVSGLWDWKLSETLRSSVAVRYDNFDLSPDGDYTNTTALVGGAINVGTANPYNDFTQVREEVSYNLGLAYQPDAINTYRITTARGADLPSFVEFGFQNNGVYGNPNTGTSIVTNYEIGYDRKISEINGLFRSAIFYQESNEMQIPGAVLDPNFTFTNAGDSQMSGIELGLEGIYQDRWNWAANYTFIHINDTLTNNRTSADASSVTNYEETQPAHTINAKLGYQADSWYADGMLQYRSSYKETLQEGVFGSNNSFFIENDDAFLLNTAFGMNISEDVLWSVSAILPLNDVAQSAVFETESQVWSSIQVNF